MGGELFLGHSPMIIKFNFRVFFPKICNLTPSPAPFVGCFRIYLRKSSHHLVIWIYRFEEVTEIYENIYNVQYFVHLRIWPPALQPKGSFTDISQKQKLYVTLLSSNVQSYYFSKHFHMAVSLLSLTYLDKRKTAAQQATACSRSKIQNTKTKYKIKTTKYKIQKLEKS